MEKYKCVRSPVIGFDVDWIVDAVNGEILLVVNRGERTDIAPYNEEFELSFSDGKLIDDEEI